MQMDQKISEDIDIWTQCLIWMSLSIKNQTTFEKYDDKGISCADSFDIQNV